MSAAAPLRMLVAVDGSAPALRALGYALRLCAEAPAAELHLVNAQPPLLYIEQLVGPREALVEHWAAETAHTVLRQALGEAARAGRTASGHVTEGDAAEAIVAKAREVGADLIVMGTRGRNPIAGAHSRLGREAGPRAHRLSGDAGSLGWSGGGGARPGELRASRSRARRTARCRRR